MPARNKRRRAESAMRLRRWRDWRPKQGSKRLFLLLPTQVTILAQRPQIKSHHAVNVQKIMLSLPRGKEGGDPVLVSMSLKCFDVVMKNAIMVPANTITPPHWTQRGTAHTFSEPHFKSVLYNNSGCKNRRSFRNNTEQRVPSHQYISITALLTT